MKVAQLLASVERTGVEAHVRVLCVALRRLGVESILVCPGPGPLTQWLVERDVPVRMAAPRGQIPLRSARLRAAVADVDLVHAHGPRALFWSAALRGLGRPSVGTVHEFHVVGEGRPLKQLVYRPFENRALESQDALIAVSEWIRARVLSGTRIPKERICVVHNSAPLLLEGPRPPAAPESRPYAVVAAHFTRAKGLDVLLEAWAKVKRVRPDVELVVLGDGQERGRLEARAKALGLSGSVRLEGWVDDAIRWIAGARLYVAPSRQESFGIAVLEAMALGVPVVATAVGGHVELLGSRAREWLVPPEDAGALAEAALRVLALTEDETLRLRRQLQNEAFARFGPEAMARGTCLAYERAIEKWRTGRRAIDAGAARRPSGPDSNQGARQGMSTLTRRRSLTPRPALPHIGRVSTSPPC